MAMLRVHSDQCILHHHLYLEGAVYINEPFLQSFEGVDPGKFLNLLSAVFRRLNHRVYCWGTPKQKTFVSLRIYTPDSEQFVQYVTNVVFTTYLATLDIDEAFDALVASNYIPKAL